MDFDFISAYEKYSNIELLKILFHPDEYREDAIQAATQILDGRNVTDDERVSAGYIIPEHTAGITGSVSAGSAVNEDLLASFDPENNKRTIGRFFRIGFTVICLFYLRLFYFYAASIYYAVHFGFFSARSLGFSLIYLLLMPFAVIRFYQKKKDGWIIILVQTIFTFIPSLLILINSWRELLKHFSFSFREFSFFLEIPLKAFIFFFLWERSISDYAGISLQQKRVMLFVCILIMIAYRWFAEVISSGTGI